MNTESSFYDQNRNYIAARMAETAVYRQQGDLSALRMISTRNAGIGVMHGQIIGTMSKKESIEDQIKSFEDAETNFENLRRIK